MEWRVYRKKKCEEVVSQVRSTREKGVMMIRSPPGCGKTQMAFDIYRYCNELEEDITCIYVDASNL